MIYNTHMYDTMPQKLPVFNIYYNYVNKKENTVYFSKYTYKCMQKCKGRCFYQRLICYKYYCMITLPLIRPIYFKHWSLLKQTKHTKKRVIWIWCIILAQNNTSDKESHLISFVSYMYWVVWLVASHCSVLKISKCSFLLSAAAKEEMLFLYL